MKYVLLVVAVALAACGRSPLAPAPIQSTSADAVAVIVVTADPPELPVGGGTVTLDISAAQSLYGFPPAKYVHVQLSTTAGELSAAEVTTDFTGHAKARWSGAATADIRATVGDLVGTARVTIKTIVLPPAPSPTPPPPTPWPPDHEPSPQPPPLHVLTAGMGWAPRTPAVGQAVTFWVTVMEGNDKPTVVSYVWNLGDEGVSSAEAMPTVVYWSASPRRVRVVAMLADGRTVSDEQTITVVMEPGG